tara:strand:- start:105 stop:1322 length:1218 start_codon:yes stop_codon:yes gene_type:complete
MKKTVIIGIICGLVLSGALIYILYNDTSLRYNVGTLTGVKDKPQILDDNFLMDEVIVGIESATALTFIENDILFLEKESGKIRHIQNGMLVDEPVWDFQVKQEGCNCFTESGLLGITSVDSDVYVYVTEELNPDESNVENRIYKFAWKDNKLQNPLLLNILPADAIMHHGGTLVVDLDGNVFASVGDQMLETSIQNYDNDIITDAGIILRVGYDQKFKSPSDSPNPLDHYYAIGIRNSFGLAVDPKTGYLWDTENGPTVYDEINLISPKFNSGWAKILGPSNEIVSLNYIPDFSYSDPEFSWKSTVAPTGISFVDEKWDEYQNSLFVGDCKVGNLYRFELNDTRDGFIFENPDLQDLVLNESDNNDEILFGKNFGCITGVNYSSDGYLYVISYLNNGAIYKIKLN